MLTTNKMIGAFARLGDLINSFLENTSSGQQTDAENYALLRLHDAINKAGQCNPWFTNDFIHHALVKLADLLAPGDLGNWVSSYGISLPIKKPKTIAVVMAGNIPAVGFHDALCVLMSGNRLLAKLSSDDHILLPALIDILTAIEPSFKDTISYTTERIQDFDGVIATGSNNSARYFDYYFRNYPHIIRHNRNGLAVLDGTEGDLDLRLLGKDVFTYFGLGCRNVSKILLKQGFDLNRLFEGFEPYRQKMSVFHKYFNNYEYNKAILLVNGEMHFDNGFLLLKHSDSIASPVSVLNYSYYHNTDDLRGQLDSMHRQSLLQCVVSRSAWLEGSVSFGESQSPGLNDYADGVDTLKWLLSLARD
jgi:hypothetical protein